VDQGLISLNTRIVLSVIPISMKTSYLPLIPVLVSFFTFPVFAAEPVADLDPAWTGGTLKNGLRYLIRKNERPANRLELRLVVNAGSILEDDDQQGLAHYLEHLAFNGTTNFAKNDMVKFLESLGVGFGPDLNAYTSFDETVYKLRLPTENPETVEKGFLILSEWASEITNSDEAIEAERGVIIEEWRGRRGAQQRVRDQQYPVMFPGSRYATRLPIGIMEVLENFEFDRLRQFYKDWYRPDMMTVVAVGDLEVEETRKRIEELFADKKGPANPRPRKAYVHPVHEDTQVGVFTDPELTGSEVLVMWKMPPTPIRTEAEYLPALKGLLVTDMLNQRLREMTQRPDAPFLEAGAYRGGYTRGGDVYLLYASLKDEKGVYVQAAEALVAESERARMHGFTDAELSRAKARRLRRLEKAFQERDTTESDAHAAQAIRHALEGDWMPGIERELEVNRTFLPEVGTDELKALLNSWVGDSNRVILAEGPSRDETDFLPEEDELLQVFETVGALTLEPYQEAALDQPLVQKAPAPGTVVSKEVREDLGMHEWTLSNGVKVLLKPTDFKQDEILLQAWSPGGIQQYGDADYRQARMAVGAVQAMGLGDFSAVDLGKKLSGKLVSVTPFVDGEREGFDGGASPADLETLLQLIYLSFQKPRTDVEAFEAMRGRLRESVRNRLANPKSEFRDLVSATLNQNHPRLEPMTLEEVDALDVETLQRLFHDRFSDASDFTFMFTGNLDLEAVEPLILTWLGGLPSAGREEESVFLDVKRPRHFVRREMKAGLEPVSEVHMVWFNDDFTYDYPNRHKTQSMAGALRIRLREVVREEKGGTYHISMWPQMEHRPNERVQLRIVFGCDPEKVEELIQAVYEVVEELKTQDLDPSYIQTVQETQRRRREVDLKENSFWDSVIPFYLWNEEDPSVVLEFENYVSKIDPAYIRETAEKLFDTKDHAVIILRPGEKEGGE